MIRYRVELHDLHAHLYRVTLTVPQPEPRQLLSLPVWIPGSYLVREFARHVSEVAARQGSHALDVEAVDKASWAVACRGRAALQVTYLVYAFDNSVRAAWLDARRGFFNGTSLFLRVHGREEDAHQVSLGRLPRGWEVATALPPGTAGTRAFTAASYDELIDHPFELGPFWRGNFKAYGVPHEFVIAGAADTLDGERLLADARRICEAQIAFWHGEHKPPFKRYVFMLNAVEEGHGGLEHRASTALIANRRDLPRKIAGRAAAGPSGAAASEGYQGLLGLISHEYFHTWNVKRLRPREFATYDLTRENTTRLLWFFEGFTSYYDDLFLVRNRQVEPAQYLRLLAKAINQVGATPGRQVSSVAQASFDAWIKYYRPDENTANATVNYYTKGALVALALDLTLRGDPDGRAGGTLDDVMRLLWTRSSGGPIEEADILAALAEVGGRSYERELAQWVHGTAELPLATLLEGMAVRWSHEPATLGLRLGARVAEGPQGLRVQAVMRGSAAEQAGLAAGDELLALDGWRLRRLEDGQLVGALDRELPLLAVRDQRLLQLTLPAAQVPGPVLLSLDDSARAPLLRRRAAWLGGS